MRNNSYCSINMEYVKLTISNNLGSDMQGTYFVQYTGNKKNIEKFLLINKNGDVHYSPKKYTYDQVIALKEFEGLFDYNCSDNLEVLMLTGKFRVKGHNREYEEDELLKWWETNLESEKYPKWSNISEKVINLAM